VGTRRWYELSPIEQQEVLAEHRLAYLDEALVNWCPALGTVLANEEVTSDGRSDRGNHPVYRRPLRQWMLRITAYAERLADELALVDWPESIKVMQRNWIGRSEGAVVDFPDRRTRRVDQRVHHAARHLFGATYMVLSPEHPLVEQIATAEHRAAVQEYQAEARSRRGRGRVSQAKTGVFTGAHAVNPVNGERIPVWIADYVLMGYGTGAIMAVPAHDQRDFRLRRGARSPAPRRGDAGRWLARQASRRARAMSHAAATGRRRLSSGRRSRERASPSTAPAPRSRSTASPRPRPRIGSSSSWKPKGLAGDTCSTSSVTGSSAGSATGASRSRSCTGPMARSVRWTSRSAGGAARAAGLPPAASDDPDAPPRPPLGRAPESWRSVVIDGVRYARELNTMPQWAGSCWYYLRFLDPDNGERFVDREIERYWMLPEGSAAGHSRSLVDPAPGVDLYVGGAEHAVLHLLYARFWHKVLHDLGHVSTPEPFGRLFNQGYIQAHAYQDERGMYVEAAEVEERDGGYVHDGKPVTRSLGKMGKSLKNAVGPDEVSEQYGCDTMRLYEMYMGPLDASKPWEPRDIIGMHRFLHRVWKNLAGEDGTPTRRRGRRAAARGAAVRIGDAAPSSEQIRLVHKTIKAVTESMEQLKFNTAIAALIDLNGEMLRWPEIPRASAEAFVLMLAPLAPHIAEELWWRLGHAASLAHERWPEWDEHVLADAQVEIPVQVMGRVRSHVTVASDADAPALERAALATRRCRLTSPARRSAASSSCRASS
jgi:leucyl-tRNA synthetase